MTDARRVLPVNRAAAAVAFSIRLLAVMSLLAAIVWFGWVETALFALVLLGLLISWLADAPRAFDAAFSLALLFAAWSSIAGWYTEIWWLDMSVHFVVTGAVSAMAYWALGRIGAVQPVADARVPRKGAGVVILTTALGLALGTLWEFGEWAGYIFVDEAIQVGYDDTLGDLAAGGLGAAAAGAALTWHGIRRNR